MYINKTHSLEVSKKRNAALMTTLKQTDLILNVDHLHEKPGRKIGPDKQAFG
jgi:hypothetical protein